MSPPIPGPPIVMYIADKVYNVFGITSMVGGFVMLLVPIVGLMAVVLVGCIWAKRAFLGKRPGRTAINSQEKCGEDEVHNFP